MNIGVLALQGAVSEHRLALEACGVRAREVRTPHDLVEIEGLVVPGGESTTLRHLLRNAGLWESLLVWEKPILGTCAGAILLGSCDDETLGKMELQLNRNAYGRQQESFEARIRLDEGDPFPGVFIRAPGVTATSGACRPQSCGPLLGIMAKSRDLDLGTMRTVDSSYYRQPPLLPTPNNPKSLPATIGWVL